MSHEDNVNCAWCHQLMSDAPEENFAVVVTNRDRTEVSYHCSAACGLQTAKRYRPGPGFVTLALHFDAYDLGVLQRAIPTYGHALHKD